MPGEATVNSQSSQQDVKTQTSLDAGLETPANQQTQINSNDPPVLYTDLQDSPEKHDQSIPSRPPLCGGPPVMTVLAIGSDYRGEGYLYGLADVIRIVRIDFVTPKVSILALPRDLWVDIPEIEDFHGITQGKINQAYLFGNKGMGYYDGPGQGPGLLARTIDANFGLKVDRYVAISMKTFVDMVDIIGGIDVELPKPVDVTQTGEVDGSRLRFGTFPAGFNHLDGRSALLLVRVRMPYNDLERIKNQTIVLKAIRGKLLSPSVLPKLPRLIDTFTGAFMTDLNLEQIEHLVCLLPKLPSENLVFYELPGENLRVTKTFDPFRNTTTSILDIDNEIARQSIQQFLLASTPDGVSQAATP
jgi:LCP family protein required for cell wall assembly